MTQKNKKLKIGILGFGNMGQAIFSLLAKNSRNQEFLYFDIKNFRNLKKLKKINSIQDLYTQSDILFICIKPQDFANLEKIKTELKDNKKIIVSILVGISISKLSKIFPGRIIRAMPNFPLQIGQGVIGWCTRAKLIKAEEKLVEEIFSQFGLSIRVKNEKMINSVTAVSGSGPAYVFLFLLALINGAVKLGFSRHDAAQMIRKTITGSIELAFAEKDLKLDTLIKKITSKGGTTEAALKSINPKKFITSWQKAMKSAYDRAVELGK